VVKESKSLGVNFKWDLLENALDFIAEALDRMSAKENTKADLKYALLHMSSGVELLFKEALRRKHWSLIFRDPDTASIGALESGDFKSVDFEASLKRLRNAAQLGISDPKQEVLRSVREKRNRLEHFGIIDSTEAVRASSACLTSIVVDFIWEHLRPEGWDEPCKTYLRHITQRLSEFSEFMRQRLKDIQASLQAARGEGLVILCSACLCGEETLVLGDPTHCLFCRDEASPEDAADLWIRHALALRITTLKKKVESILFMTVPSAGERRLSIRGISEKPLGRNDMFVSLVAKRTRKVGCAAATLAEHSTGSGATMMGGRARPVSTTGREASTWTEHKS
jgi:hypothetical protein